MLQIIGSDHLIPEYLLSLKRISLIESFPSILSKSIDRFSRNSKEIKKEWENITQEIKADIKVIDMPLLDTTQYRDMLGTFVSVEVSGC